MRVAASMLATLGVVIGEIGTSPLHALPAVFRARGAVEPTEADVHGVVSLVLWTITPVVSLTYVARITRADNDGEGGTMALIALVLRMAARRRVKGRSSRSASSAPRRSTMTG